MSFTGDLEHLPIVDVIQLLHSTRKSGTLSLKSPKGESQLGFRDGFIVSANHVNNCIRIGQILLDMKVLSQEDLEQALQQQKIAGAGRKPLIEMLIESSKIKKESAYKGLETLIEMTIVDILTWTEGTFALDVDNIILSDDYRYLPEVLNQDISLNTQNVLMDALRIFDERVRDGNLAGAFPDMAANEEIACGTTASEISADDLGLDELDTFTKKIPDVFSAIKDHATKAATEKMNKELGKLPATEQENPVSFFTTHTGTAVRIQRRLAAEPVQALIVLSKDDLISQSLTTVCKQEGFFVFTTDDAENLDLIIDQSIARELSPVLAIDAPDNPAPEVEEKIFSLLHQKKERYPQISIILTASREDYTFSLNALQQGFQAVFPRPRKDARHGTYVKEFIKFLESFPHYLRVSSYRPDQKLVSLFKESLFEISAQKGATDVSNLLLRFSSAVFVRALTLIVREGELVAERGIGMKAENSNETAPAMNFKIPLSQSTILHEVIEKGEMFYRHSNDPTVKNHLFAQIGAPQSSKILFLPLKAFGKVIALIYADFGTKPASPVQLDLLDILARQATLVLEHAAYKKKSEMPV